MSPFNSHGDIRQQDAQARNIARQTISTSLFREAQQTARLVSNLVGRILDSTVAKQPVDQLWKQIQDSPQLAPIKSRADLNVADYPEFQGWVAGRRRRIERQHKIRLAQVVSPVEDRRRFAHTPGLPS